MNEPSITTSEDATKLLIQLLKNPDHGSCGAYGYDFFLPHAIITYFRKNNIAENIAHGFLEKSMPFLYTAAWELCRRGILRPGVNKYGAQATNQGNAGDGYSLTPFGEIWLREVNKDDFVPTEPERFGEILGQYKDRFGVGFHERGQQAIRCYGAHAYLACCSMCGAAAESVLLALAVKKRGGEQEVLKEYSSASGRHKIENLLIGKAPSRTKEEFKGLMNLLKYWRDESSHGKASLISDNEAYTSLAILLRFAMFANDNYQVLTEVE
jgi:hypothetical protein